MRNFFKGGNEAPLNPETKANSEPEAVTPAEIVDVDAIEAEIAAIELANASAFDLERERIDKEEADRKSRESIVREITDMVKGNTKLSDFTNESVKYKEARKEYREALQAEDAHKHGGEEYPKTYRRSSKDMVSEVVRLENDKTLDRPWDDEKRRQLRHTDLVNIRHEDYQALIRQFNHADKLVRRIDRLLSLQNLQSSTDLELKKKELSSKIKDLEYKMEVLSEEGSADLKKSFAVHEMQQNEIAENPVAFAIETVRVSNPEEFDRLFPDIDKLIEKVSNESRYR